jgi:hypothetical protein
MSDPNPKKVFFLTEYLNSTGIRGFKYKNIYLKIIIKIYIYKLFLGHTKGTISPDVGSYYRVQQTKSVLCAGPLMVFFYNICSS